MEEKSHEKTDVKYAEQARNANSKTIFKNNVLTCQFLRDYSGIDLFAGICPEDIEDVSEHYVALLGIEFEADTVKRVRVHVRGQESYIYVLPLIEHKSYVDYDVAMQLLRYMVVIWYDYRKTQERIKEGISRTKRFRYPLIVPIVYYEGADVWSADMHLRDRIAFGDMMKDFIPDYTYQVFHVHEYSNEKLLKMQYPPGGSEADYGQD